jgi:peptidoglycan/LPS O-acetylase OafA/YrhL
VHHACTLYPRTLRPADAGLVLRGLAQLGRFNTEAVLLFFVLSGFSIRLSIEPRGLTPPGELARYVERRLLRILPPYWFALALSFVLARLFAPLPEVAWSWSTLLGNLLFLQTAVGVSGAWFLPYAGNGPLWSLSFEVFYYAAFALLVSAVAGRRPRLVAVLVASAAALLWNAWWPWPWTLFLASALIWYVGVELAELYLSDDALAPWSLVVVSAALLAASQLTAQARIFYGVWIASLLWLAGAALIRWRVRLVPLAAWLERPLWTPLARVGDLSYALYLLHVPVLRASVTEFGDGFAGLTIGIALSFALAQQTERAARRLMRLRRPPAVLSSPASYVAAARNTSSPHSS